MEDNDPLHLAEPSQNLSAMREKLDEMDAYLAALSFTGRSRDGAVEATVTGSGKLQDLRIDDRALRSGHPEKIGPAVVEAINASRLQASTASLEQLKMLRETGTFEQSRPITAQPLQRHPPRHQTPQTKRPSRRQQRPDFEDEEPLFHGLDDERRRRT